MKNPPPPNADETKWYNTKINFYMVLLVVSTFTSGGVMYHLGVKTGEQNVELEGEKWQTKAYLDFIHAVMYRAYVDLPPFDDNGTMKNEK